MNFVPNPNLEQELATEVEPFMAETREDVAREVRENTAAVDEGTYRDSVRVEGDQVVADSDHASALELGTSDTPTFAPLRRATENVLGTQALRSRR